MRQLLTRMSLASREQKWRLYADAFPPRREERVLDLGVSALDDLPGENFFLRRFPYPDRLTAVGIDELDQLAERYPGVRFVRADGRDLPFEDREFDVVHSNAVVEHVGPEPEQARFLAELVRVASAGFVTTPNRWFPIESHTALPVLHWLPADVFSRAIDRIGIDPGPLWLLSGRRFRRLFPEGLELKLVSQRMAGWPATLIALFRHA